MSRTDQPYAHSRSLPPYRGILAVDAKDFTGYPAVQHGSISRMIPELRGGPVHGVTPARTGHGPAGAVGAHR